MIVNERAEKTTVIELNKEERDALVAFLASVSIFDANTLMHRFGRGHKADAANILIDKLYRELIKDVRGERF